MSVRRYESGQGFGGIALNICYSTEEKGSVRLVERRLMGNNHRETLGLGFHYV